MNFIRGWRRHHGKTWSLLFGMECARERVLNCFAYVTHLLKIGLRAIAVILQELEASHDVSEQGFSCSTQLQGAEGIMTRIRYYKSQAIA